MTLREQIVAVTGGDWSAINWCIVETEADAALAVVAEWLRSDEAHWSMATETESHFIEDDRCVCGRWADGKDGPSWDQHMARVSAYALAGLITGGE